MAQKKWKVIKNELNLVLFIWSEILKKNIRWLADIKNMIQTASEGGNDELAVVEDIFEKNLNNFNKIV